MLLIAFSRWPRRTVAVAGAVLSFFAGRIAIKLAEAAFVAVSAAIPGYYAPAPR
jgi:hypothetical protein